MAKKLTSSKAREILHDKSVHGHPLTDKQRRFFGAIAGGAKPYKAESGGWLDKYTPKAQNGIEGTMGGLTDIGFNYNGAWGGPSMQNGGNLMPAMAGANQTVPMAQNGTLEKIYSKWPALKKLGKVTMKPDESFTREKTGVGDIEFFSPNTPQVTYPSGYVAPHPGPGTYGILYNPNTNNEQNIRLDMLHGMSEADSHFKRLRNSFERSVKNSDIYGDMKYWYGKDKESGNAEDGKRRWIDNYVDGQLRTLLFEGDRAKNNYSDEEAQELLAHPKIKKKFDKLNTYLQKGQFGASIPGAVGFTYARTAGAAPANGPYAKKTKASAQNGMEMKYYQSGLDFKPKTISQDGTVIDPMGYWNPENVGNPVIVPSTDITMEGVDQPLIGISDTGDVQYMQPGKDYSFDGEYVTEYPLAQKGTKVPAATTADSLRIYNMQLAQDAYYKKFKDAFKKQKVLNYYDDLYNSPNSGMSIDNNAAESLNTYRNLLKSAETSPDVWLRDIKKWHNVNNQQAIQMIASSLAGTKQYNKDPNVIYYKDLITPLIDPAAPFSIYDKRIKPQGITVREPNIDASFPGEAVNTFYYDTLAIKPYNMRTPQEKIEWEKKYGKPKLESKPQVKPQVKPQPKKEVEKKQEVVKKQEPVTPIVERRQNVYEGTPVYSPGAGSGLGSALIGFMGPKGDTTYIKPEDYERFAVPKYGKEYIEKKKMKNGGVSVNMADQYPIEKLDQSLNFTNYNKPTKGGWLDKYK